MIEGNNNRTNQNAFGTNCEGSTLKAGTVKYFDSRVVSENEKGQQSIRSTHTTQCSLAMQSPCINARQVKIECIAEQIKKTFPLPDCRTDFGGSPVGEIKERKSKNPDSSNSSTFKGNTASSETDIAFSKQKDSRSYLLCNEFHYQTEDQTLLMDFKRVINAIDAMKPDNMDRQAVVSPINVAMLVGESCLLAAAPAIAKQCDVVLMTDYDHKLLHVQLKRLELIRQCKSVKDEDTFVKTLGDMFVKIFDGGTITNSSWINSKQKEDLQHFHPFHPGRLSLVRDAVNKLTIIPVRCNLYSQAHMENLSCILKRNGAEVRLLNLSNVMESYDLFQYINEFSFNDGRPVAYKHLKRCLPIAKQALCVFSVFHSTRFYQLRICTPETYWKEIDETSCLVGRRSSSIWLENLRTTINELPCHTPYKDIAERDDMWVEIKRLLAHANSSQIKEISDTYPTFHQWLKARSHISTESKNQILSWIGKAIQYWAQPLLPGNL